MLSALLFSGSAIAQESDLQQELEDKNLFYWAQKPAQCSSADAVVDLMKRHGENPTVWMEGITGFPNGAFNKSKFVIAINHEANPITWSLIEFVDDRLDHDFRYAIDYSKIKKGLGWSPKTTFDGGIKKTINWYMSKK